MNDTHIRGLFAIMYYTQALQLDAMIATAQKWQLVGVT